MGTVKSKRDAHAAIRFWKAVADFRTYVLHGCVPWEETNSVLDEKAIAVGVKNLYQKWEAIDFKFHEGTLVLDAVRLNEERDAEETYVVSLDGNLTNLAWNEDVNVLPSKTPHRTDDVR